MPRRPLPSTPHGPRRTTWPRAQLLACPRLSPEWELAALRALIKPQTKGAILHRKGDQNWPSDGNARAQSAIQSVSDRLGFSPQVHLPATGSSHGGYSGEYFLVADVIDAAAPEALALAAVISTALPELWFVIGRLFVKNGTFYRRERGYKLWLAPATNVHLPGAVRSALHGLL